VSSVEYYGLDLLHDATGMVYAMCPRMPNVGSLQRVRCWNGQIWRLPMLGMRGQMAYTWHTALRGRTTSEWHHMMPYT
jgi:hypothetical protein